MSLKQDHNKIKNDITLANNRIKELETTREILNQAIQDILKDKRKIDKYNMELEDKISGRNVTDLQTKQNYKNEERKMRIKYEKSLDTLKKTGVNLVDKGGDEETHSKEVLDEKLKLEQDLLDLNEELNVMSSKQQDNRENLVKYRVKNSQLDTQLQMLQIEEDQLTEQNKKLLEDNELLTNDNLDKDNKIKILEQRIRINNLLKNIDIEEMQLLANNNKKIKRSFEDIITQWHAILQA